MRQIAKTYVDTDQQGALIEESQRSNYVYYFLTIAIVLIWCNYKRSRIIYWQLLLGRLSFEHKVCLLDGIQGHGY